MEHSYTLLDLIDLKFRVFNRHDIFVILSEIEERYPKGFKFEELDDSIIVSSTSLNSKTKIEISSPGNGRIEMFILK